MRQEVSWCKRGVGTREVGVRGGCEGEGEVVPKGVLQRGEEIRQVFVRG